MEVIHLHLILQIEITKRYTLLFQGQMEPLRTNLISIRPKWLTSNLGFWMVLCLTRSSLIPNVADNKAITFYQTAYTRVKIKKDNKKWAYKNQANWEVPSVIDLAVFGESLSRKLLKYKVPAYLRPKL